MDAHLMPFPVHVFSDGSLKPLDDLSSGANPLDGTIPDYPAAKMFGKKVTLPYVLTT